MEYNNSVANFMVRDMGEPTQSQKVVEVDLEELTLKQ